MATNAMTANNTSSLVDDSSRMGDKKVYGKMTIPADAEIWVGCALIDKDRDGKPFIVCGCSEHRGKNATYDNKAVWAIEHQEKDWLSFKEDPLGSGVIVTMTTNAIQKFLQFKHPELSAQIEGQKKMMTADDIKNSRYYFDYKNKTITFDRPKNTYADPKKVPNVRAPAGPTEKGFAPRGFAQQGVAAPAQPHAHWVQQHKSSNAIAEAEAARKKKEEHERALKKAAFDAKKEARAALDTIPTEMSADAIALFEQEAIAQAHEAAQLALEQKKADEAELAKALEVAREAARIERQKKMAEDARRMEEIESAREDAKRKVAIEVEHRKKQAELTEKKRKHEIREAANEKAFKEVGISYIRKPFEGEQPQQPQQPQHPQQPQQPQYYKQYKPAMSVYAPPTAEEMMEMTGFAYGVQSPAQLHNPKYEVWCNNTKCDGVRCDYNHKDVKICNNEFVREDEDGCTFVGCKFNHFKGYVEKMKQRRADYKASKFKKQQPSHLLTDLELMDASSAGVQKPHRKTKTKTVEFVDPAIDEIGLVISGMTHLDIQPVTKISTEEKDPTEEEVLTNAVNQRQSEMSL